MNEIIRNAQSSVAQASLDPQDWSEFRTLAHRMLDEAIDGIANVRARPVWQPIPHGIRAALNADVPREASDLADVYGEFAEHVAPYATGNVHPGFMGWVHGGGTAVGMLAEMLAAGLNANLGGRDHMPIEVERQIVAWMRRLFDFPESASGIFVTGTSMANLMAVLVARTCALGTLARQQGIGNDGALLTAYTSQAAHGCVSRAMDIAGLGTDELRAGEISGDARAGRAPAGIAGAGKPQHRLLPLPRRRCGQSRDRRRCPGVRNCGALEHDAGRQVRDPRCHRQSPYR
ncbi:hypothetical protein M2232_003454 [Bradyrhizobium japonicum]|nr:hypothetical protein [Bradyrhizobium japonicum]MCW2344536.1 hypothetical protein [Bradyrhizobium japonicum]